MLAPKNKNTISIKAFFKSYDNNTQKLSLVFLDEEFDRFTKNFLSNYYKNAEKKPINNIEFYVKCTNHSKIFIDKQATVPGDLTSLVDKVICAKVYIHNYSFTDKNSLKKITGWYLTLVKILPA